MDFEDTPEEAAFRTKARAFLDANAERRKPGAVEGYRRGQDAPGAMERAQDFQRRQRGAIDARSATRSRLRPALKSAIPPPPAPADDARPATPAPARSSPPRQARTTQ